MKTNLVAEKTVCDFCGKDFERIYVNSKEYFLTHIENYNETGITGDYHFPICIDRKIQMDKETKANIERLENVIGKCSYSECAKELKGKDSHVYIDGQLFCSPICKGNSDYFKMHGTKREDELKAQSEARLKNELKKKVFDSLTVEQLQAFLEKK